MELPKNVTQIGEANPHCKVYVEDYVVSYLKQLNAIAVDKELAVALYGMSREEGNVTYLFLYGACKVNFLQRETRHLSQAQHQEIERNRKKYFKDYHFLAYRILDGEMIEGFHICENGISRYVEGYYQFYEKNDSMLAYMLEVRKEVTPEAVEQDKYEAVRKRQEERRMVSAQNAGGLGPSGRPRKKRGMAVAAFALLCAVGVGAANADIDWVALQGRAEDLVKDFFDRQLPEVVEVIGSGVNRVDTLVAEDKLADALLAENEKGTPAQEEQVSAEAAEGAAAIEDAAQTDTVRTDMIQTDMIQTEGTQTDTSQVDTARTGMAQADLTSIGMPQTQGEGTGQGDEVQDATETQTDAVAQTDIEQVQVTDEAAGQNTVDQAQDADAGQAEPAPVAYTVRPGDTLTAISMRNYGNDTRVAEICEINRIVDANDIKVGEKILLP